jgi:hypothetical protein
MVSANFSASSEVKLKDVPFSEISICLAADEVKSFSLLKGAGLEACIPQSLMHCPYFLKNICFAPDMMETCIT